MNNFINNHQQEPQNIQSSNSKEQTLEFYKKIIEENKRFYRPLHMFSPEYFDFISNFVMSHKFTPKHDQLPFPFQYSKEETPEKHLKGVTILMSSYDLNLLKF